MFLLTQRPLFRSLLWFLFCFVCYSGARYSDCICIFSCVVKPVTKCETVKEKDCHSVQEEKCGWEMEQKCISHPGKKCHIRVRNLISGLEIVATCVLLCVFRLRIMLCYVKVIYSLISLELLS